MVTVYWFESNKKMGKTLPIDFVKMLDANKSRGQEKLRNRLKIKNLIYYSFLIAYFGLFVNGLLKNYDFLNQEHENCLEKQRIQQDSFFGFLFEYDCVDKTSIYNVSHKLIL